MNEFTRYLFNIFLDIVLIVGIGMFVICAGKVLTDLVDHLFYFIKRRGK